MQTFSLSEILNSLETLESGNRIKVKCRYCPTERNFSADEPIENLIKFAQLHSGCKERKEGNGSKKL